MFIYIEAVSFPGDNGESIFQVRHGESLKKFDVVDGGIRTQDPTTHGPADDAIFVAELVGC